MQIPEFFSDERVSFSDYLEQPLSANSMFQCNLFSQKQIQNAVFTQVPFLSQMAQANLGQREKSYFFSVLAAVVPEKARYVQADPFQTAALGLS